MSCFQLATGTVNRIALYIFENRLHEINGVSLFHRIPNPAVLSRRMQALNIRAIKSRYRGKAKDMCGPVEAYKAPRPYAANEPDFTTQFGRLAIFKALECFLYNSCEDATRLDPLYRVLHLINARIGKRILKDMIATNNGERGVPPLYLLKQYNDLPWG